MKNSLHEKADKDTKSAENGNGIEAAEAYTEVGDMSVITALHESLERKAVLGEAKNLSPEEIRIWQEHSLLEWYQFMCLSLLKDVESMNRLNRNTPQKQKKLEEVSDRLFNAELQGGWRGSKKVATISFSRIILREALRPIKMRLDEMEDACKRIAEERGLRFTAKLPSPYDTLYSRIVDDITSN